MLWPTDKDKESAKTFEFFINTQSCQCWNYCQPCILIYLQFSSPFTLIDVGKCEIRNQGIYENYISWIQSLLDELVLKGRAKTKLAMLALLHGRMFVKNSSDEWFCKLCEWSSAGEGKFNKRIIKETSHLRLLYFEEQDVIDNVCLVK